MDVKISEFTHLGGAFPDDGLVPIISSNSNYSVSLSLFLPRVSNITPIEGGYVDSLSYVDETLYLSSGAALSVYSWNLPSSSNSRVGQIKTFLSDQNITTFNVSVSDGGSIVGNSLTTIYSNDTYSFQCVSTSSNGVWLRLA